VSATIAAGTGYAERLLGRDDVAWPALPPLGPANLANAQRVLDGRFLLIGEEHALADGFSWTGSPSRDKEWQIAWHKHYFLADLVYAASVTGDDAYLRRFAALLRSWLDEMGSGFIALSDAQVEAKRLESWITALTLLRDVEWRGILGDDLLERWVARMGDEALYVARNLKRVRNHRTFQLASVFAVGVLFPEREAAAHLRELGRELLTENLLTDFLDDGVHVEQSTHYHQLVCETAVAFVELSIANGVPVAPALLERLHAALRFCAWAQWPDAGLPLVNDSDTGDLRPVLARGAALFDDAELRFAATLGAEGSTPAMLSRDFPVSGYVVLTDGARGQHVLYDCARLGEGSHSHYDLFSFTYWAAGGPLIVDPGRFTYSSDPDADGVDWRHRFKSTAAHNTVQIDGRDQTRYVSRTKHGPDVAVEGRTVALGGDLDWIRASARSAEYAPVHERLLVYPRRDYLLIVDRIDMVDGAEHACDLRFHFDDSLAPLRASDGDGDGVACVETERGAVHVLGGAAWLEGGWVSREYGVKHPAAVLRAHVRSAEPVTFVSVVAPRGVTVERLRWDAAAGVVAVDGARDGVAFADRLAISDGGVDWSRR
jgi:Heparinase II/III-like protein/Heparinase II/III N-terminus